MFVKRFLRRFNQARQSYGLLGLLRRSLLNGCPLSKHVIYRREYDPSDTAQLASEMTVERHRAADEVPADVASLYGTENFCVGAELWVGRVGGALAGVGWSRSGQRRDDYFVTIGPTDGVIFGCHVRHEFRGRGIYPTMLKYMVDVLRQDGIRAVYIDCKSWNRPSLVGIRKAQFEPVGSCWCLVLLGRVWRFWSDGEGDHHPRKQDGQGVSS